jgi:Plasmid recombination enzyme
VKNSLFLAFEKLKGGGRVLAAARHNKRELQNERGAASHIDARRSSSNYCLAGEVTARGIDTVAKQKLSDAGVTKLRKDAVRAIEAVFSLPSKSEINHRAYFTDCTRWMGERFGIANVLSSDVHLDEAAPHCHVLFVPLVDGRMRGSDLLGGRARLAELANDFHANVATLYGLPRRAPKLAGVGKRALAEMIVKRLLSDSDAATTSRLWQSIREAIENDPEPFAAQLGIDTPRLEIKPKRKSFVETMTGTGQRTTEDDNRIGFASTPRASNPILCRDHSSADDVSQPKSAPDDRQSVSDAVWEDTEKNLASEASFIETTRVHDCDLSVDHFNPETGEFVSIPKRPQLQKLAAAKWVNAKLSKATTARGER